MSDRWAIALAVVICAGAMAKISIAFEPLLALAVLAFILRSPVLLCISCALLSSSLSTAAWISLDLPVTASVDSNATLVSDPDIVNGAARAELRISGRHYQVWARGMQRSMLQDLLAGQRVHVVGTTRPLSGASTPSLRRRHITANLDVESITKTSDGNALAILTNDFRQLLQSGSRSLPPDQRSLLSGFVLGDDRNQSQELHQAFLNSGLTHLLAVSGENVAFVFLVFAPMLERLSILGRLLGGIAVLIVFGTLTRWEPSVVRAEAMVFVSLLASCLGRPITPIRSLSLAIAGAVLIDPFLVGSIGFLLSVSACIGMVLLAQPLTRVLVGPNWIRRVCAYSLAAQIGVAPVEYLVFDGIPLAALPANVLVEPVAGLVMIWGIVGGAIAGLVGGPVATLINVPNRIMLSYVEFVARWASSLHLGMWTPKLACGCAVALALLSALRHMRTRLPSTACQQQPPNPFTS